MRLPPQAAAVRRDTIFQPMCAVTFRGILPQGKPTGEAISCWGANPKALICFDDHNNPAGAACCPQNAATASFENGLCVCQ